MFKKYSSIENHYQNKYIQRFLEWHPEIADAKFTVEHKIDGANVSILIDENDNVFWAKRSGIMPDDENFKGINDIKHEYDELIKFLIEWKHKEEVDTIQLYGELHGPGIQNRANYGDKKKIEFFDAKLDGEYMAPVYFYELMADVGWTKQIRVIEIVEGLDNALNVKTRYRTDAGTLIEGVVIKPLFHNYYSPVGERFVLKKKNEEFAEKSKTKKKSPKKHSPEVEETRQEFESFINENRALSVFSKEGEIGDGREIGKYIKLVLEDAKEDFFKENSIDGFTKDEEKYIFNVSGQIVPILRKYL